MTRRTRIHPAALCAAGLFAASGIAAIPATAAAHGGETHTVNIRFAAVAGKTPVACGKAIPGLGTPATTAQLADLRFYVSDVKMLRSDGRAVTVKLDPNSRYRVTRKGAGVTLIDLENGRGLCKEGTPGVNPLVRGTVPHGTYVGAQMTVGVPFALNHSDVPAAPAPLNIDAMAWSWQAGRKFAKIEVADPAGPTGTWSEKTFMVHLGSTGCEGNPASGQTVRCRASNRAAVRLARFNPQRQQIAVDLRGLLSGSDIKVNKAAAPGCMSGPTDPECGPIFRALGINWLASGNGTGRSPSGPTQRLFRVIAR